MEIEKEKPYDIVSFNTDEFSFRGRLTEGRLSFTSNAETKLYFRVLGKMASIVTYTTSSEDEIYNMEHHMNKEVSPGETIFVNVLLLDYEEKPTLRISFLEPGMPPENSFPYHFDIINEVEEEKGEEPKSLPQTSITFQTLFFFLLYACIIAYINDFSTKSTIANLFAGLVGYFSMIFTISNFSASYQNVNFVKRIKKLEPNVTYVQFIIIILHIAISVGIKITPLLLKLIYLLLSLK